MGTRTVALLVRRVPRDVHRTIKAAAALAGMSLSDFIVKALAAACRAPFEIWTGRMGQEGSWRRQGS